MTTLSRLWLAVCKWCKIQEIHIFTFNKIYLHSSHYFTSSNCIFTQLQGIVFIQLQGNDILVNYQGNKFIIDLFTKSIIIRGNYIRSRTYINFKEISSFKENIFIQGNYIHSRKRSHLRNIYSFKFKAICSFKETIFIQQRCVRGHSRNIYSKIFHSHFMIIISFTISISWIEYSYNSFRLMDKEIADMIEGSVL